MGNRISMVVYLSSRYLLLFNFNNDINENNKFEITKYYNDF